MPHVPEQDGTSEDDRFQSRAAPDPSAWVDEHGDYLYRYALMRLRDPALAEDAVQETLLAALQARHAYGGRSAERTWLTGILKHKLVDHFRRASRQAHSAFVEGEGFEHDELFRAEGEWKGHFDPTRAPVEWCASPAELLERGEFWEVFGGCLRPLPERITSAFTLREMEGVGSEESCGVL